MAKIAFTAKQVADFRCPPDKAQAFLWDATSPGLGLRATPGGKPAYVFQGTYLEKAVRITIGSPDAWTIPQAQKKARELQRLIDEGKDPRSLKREAIADAKRIMEAERAKQAEAVTIGQAWQEYLEDRRPHWGERHMKDHETLSRAGGESAKRGTRGRGVTIAGPLHPLMGMALADLTPKVVEAWAAEQAKTRPTPARLAWRLLRAFLTWCGSHDVYGPIVGDKNPAKTRKAVQTLGKSGTKSDVLTREQLPAWFKHVRDIANPTISAALQVMLLTGARPGEVLSLRWDDINWRWRGIQIRDKVEGTREIPLTPYVESLLAALPRRNEWVFASARALDMNPKNIKRRQAKAEKRGTEAPAGDVLETSARGYITEPNAPHTRACRAAGIEGLTLHGLRRSFASLTEWLEIPAGVVAQIQGHKPSATAEKHYKVRPLDLLRLHHERIEAWTLEQAGVKFTPKEERKGLTLAA